MPAGARRWLLGLGCESAISADPPGMHRGWQMRSGGIRWGCSASLLPPP